MIPRKALCLDRDLLANPLLGMGLNHSEVMSMPFRVLLRRFAALSCPSLGLSFT